MPRRRGTSGPPGRGTRGNIENHSAAFFPTLDKNAQRSIARMAEAVAADGRVPIRARLAAACAVHRQRWGLPPLPADAEAVAAAYARRPRPPS
jgi:hypothetical protein